MFSAIGALLMLFTTYNIGREATKIEIEYKCKHYTAVSLATVEIECKEIKKLDWIKKK
jgi:hypothetical protein